MKAQAQTFVAVSVQQSPPSGDWDALQEDVQMISSRVYRGSKAKAIELAETTVSFLASIASMAILHQINYLFTTCFRRNYLKLL